MKLSHTMEISNCDI